VKVLKETGFLDSCSKLMSNPKFNSNYKLLSLLVRIFEILLKWEVGILYLAEEFPLELLQSLSKPDVPHSPGVKFATYFSQCVTVSVSLVPVFLTWRILCRLMIQFDKKIFFRY